MVNLRVLISLKFGGLCNYTSPNYHMSLKIVFKARFELRLEI